MNTEELKRMREMRKNVRVNWSLNVRRPSSHDMIRYFLVRAVLTENSIEFLSKKIKKHFHPLINQRKIVGNGGNAKINFLYQWMEVVQTIMLLQHNDEGIKKFINSDNWKKERTNWFKLVGPMTEEEKIHFFKDLFNIIKTYKFYS